MKYILLISIIVLTIGVVSADYTVGPGIGGSDWDGNSTASLFDWDDETIVNDDNIILSYENKIKNSGFEDVNSSSPWHIAQYWANTSWIAQDVVYFSRNNTVVGIPSQSWCMRAYRDVTTGCGIYSDYFSVDNSTTYTITYQGKTGDAWSRVYMIWFDDESTTTLADSDHSGISPSTDWNEVTFTSSTSDDLGGDGVGVGRARLYRFNTIGDCFWDKIKVNCSDYYLDGNRTTWHDAGSGQETHQITVNCITPANTNYTVYYRENNTGNYVSLASAQTGNQTISISGTKYQDTEVRVKLLGNTTQTSELIGIIFKTQASAAAPSITAYGPLGTIWPEVNDSQLFNVTVNQTTQCRWYVNGTLKQTNVTPSLTHAYTNTSLSGGGCNVTAVVNNTNGTDSQTWIFEVGADSVTWIVLKDQPTNQTLIAEWNVTWIGSNITDWGYWQNHTFNGWQYFFRFTNGTEIMNTTATSDNESLWFNHTSLLPTGVYFLNVSEAPPGITNVQNGSISDTSQYVNWTVNQTANNIVIYDTGAVSADSTACDGQWSATHACANATDGNWSSYAESAGALLAYAYFNYTIPSGANQSESLWHVKDNAGQANLTIPSACWGSTLYLRAMCSDIGNSATWQCYNGTSWITLRTSVANIIYEEEMTFKYTSTWNNSTAAPNITLTGLTASTTYNFHARSYNLANASLSGNSSTYSFTTAAAAPYNDITLYVDEYGLINNWTTAQNCSQIDANTSNCVCMSWYNHTSGLWESYRSGYGYNADAEIPENNSAFIFVDGQTTVSATPHTGGITIQNASWFYGMLPETTAKTLTEIETEMDADGLDVWSLYGWSNASQAYTETGGYSVAPNEGYAVYVNTTGEYTP